MATVGKSEQIGGPEGGPGTPTLSTTSFDGWLSGIDRQSLARARRRFPGRATVTVVPVPGLRSPARGMPENATLQQMAFWYDTSLMADSKSGHSVANDGCSQIARAPRGGMCRCRGVRSRPVPGRCPCSAVAAGRRLEWTILAHQHRTGARRWCAWGPCCSVINRILIVQNGVG